MMRKCVVALLLVAGLVMTPFIPAHAATVTPKPAQVTGEITLAPGITFVPDVSLRRAGPYADLTFGWVTGTIYFNISETLAIGNGWGGAGIIESACVAFGMAVGQAPGAAYMAAVCGANLVAIVYTAATANNSASRRCLKLKVPYILTWVQPGTYYNSRCHW